MATMISLNDALNAWKKAKPATLGKTGVSEALKSLGPNPTDIANFSGRLADLEKTKKVLEAAVANKLIKLQKNAYTCADGILTGVVSHMYFIKTVRLSFGSSVREAIAAGNDFVKTPTTEVFARIDAALKKIEKLMADNKSLKMVKEIQPVFAIALPARRYLKAKEPQSTDKPDLVLAALKTHMSRCTALRF